MKLFITLLLSLTCLVCQARQGAIDYKITSSDHSLRSQARDNIEQYLDQLDIKTTDDDAYINQQIIKHASQAMQAVGYYNPQITINIKQTKSAN